MMNADKPKKLVRDFLYERESYEIRGSFFAVWTEFRGVFKEKVIERALRVELKSRGLVVETQKRIPIFYRGESVGVYVHDILVEEKILIELKAKQFLTLEDKKQFWYYLRGSHYKLGFLVNFGQKGLEIYRKVYDSVRNEHRAISGDQRSDQRLSSAINGFTILEVLVVIGLTMFLMGKCSI